jgi:hypothetical protein
MQQFLMTREKFVKKHH